MAIDQTIDTKLMAQRYADAVRKMPDAREIYFRLHGGVAEFWLITAPTDVDTQMDFYGASQLLYDQFPGTPIDFHVINPAHYIRFDLSMILPPGVEHTIIHAQHE